MYGFSSYYWNVGELSEEDQRAVAALNTASPSLPSAGYATHDLDGLLAAYQTLLHSADFRARGVALDQYTYAAAQNRWVDDNPMDRFDDEVLARAREMLAVAPEQGVPLADQPRVIACWNSALGVLAFLAPDGDTTDLPRIIDVLDAAFAGDLLDTYAMWALEVRLIDADEPTCARAGAWLAGVFTDERIPVKVRVSAIDVFKDDRFSARLGQRDALVGLLDHPELSVRAAWALAGFGDAYDQAVRRAVAGWPDDARYPANEVRRILEEADELAQARATLAGGGNSEAVADAVGVVREHGDATDLAGLLAIFDDVDIAKEVAECPEDELTFGAALDQCLDTADESAIRRANTRLAEVFTDDKVPNAVRALAVRPFWRRSEHWADQESLIGLLGHDDLRLSTAAAYALVHRAEAVVRQAAARWPDDAPYPAEKVRETLAELETLASARRTVTDAMDSPVDVASLMDAVSTLLMDGEDDDSLILLALIDGDGIAEVFGRAGPEQAGKLAGKLRSALRYLLPDGTRDPRYVAAAKRLAGLVIVSEQ